MTAISTPCVKLCILDGPSGLCLGCGRSLDEIGRWASLDEPTRRGIMAELSARLARSSVDRLAAAGRPNPRRASLRVS